MIGLHRRWQIHLGAFIAVFLALIAAGCSRILAPQQDSAHYFILAAVGSSSDTKASSAANLVVALGPINFPEYLSRSEMVTRMSDDRIDVSSNKRWAEPLDVSFKRVLAHDLSMALGGAQVAVFPWLGEAPKFRYRIDATIDRFDADAQGIARLDARWMIRDGATGRIVDSSSSALSASAAGSETSAAVSALNQVTSRFAAQLAGAITRLTSPA